jgi:DNA-directed RNA polymerase subunit RPC12/RpoP
MNQDKDKPRRSIFHSLAAKTAPEQQEVNPEKGHEKDQAQEPIVLAPALPELGTAPCPICRRRVTVFVTKTKRPFINCGYCSARIFYNGSRSMRLLERQLKPRKLGWSLNGKPIRGKQHE